MRRLAFLATLPRALAAMAEPGSSRLTPIDEAGFKKVLAAHKGKVVLINFWATWCGPCREEMPLLSKLDARLRSKGFVLITVSADEPEQEEAARQFLAQSGITAPSYLQQAKNDDAFINAIDSKWSGALPALFLYDRTGRKAHSFIGETEIPQLEAAIAKLL